MEKGKTGKGKMEKRNKEKRKMEKDSPMLICNKPPTPRGYNPKALHKLSLPKVSHTNCNLDIGNNKSKLVSEHTINLKV